jgi:hypothetical protein
MTLAIGLLGALAALASLAALVRVHLLPTGNDPVRNAVGDYGAGAGARYYRRLTAASAYAALFAAAGLARTVHPVPQLPVFLLIVFAAARLAIPSFPADSDRSRPTAAGLVHVRGLAHILLAEAAFGSLGWCAAVLPGRVDWPGLHGLLAVLGWILAATAIAAGLALLPLLGRGAAPVLGVVERLFSAAMLAWLLVVSLHFV